MHARPQDVRHRLDADGFDGRDLHASPPLFVFCRHVDGPGNGRQYPETSPMVSQRQQATGGATMKIQAIRIHLLEAPLSETFEWSFDRTSSRTSCLVEDPKRHRSGGMGRMLRSGAPQRAHRAVPGRAADRARPAGHRSHLAGPVQRHPRPGSQGADDHRVERHRHRAVGPEGQAFRGADPRAARRADPHKRQGLRHRHLPPRLRARRATISCPRCGATSRTASPGSS